MEPSQKSSAMNEFLEAFSKSAMGRSRLECIKNNVCVSCGRPAVEFVDRLSKKEFSLSGLCQECQDSVFGGG